LSCDTAARLLSAAVTLQRLQGNAAPGAPGLAGTYIELEHAKARRRVGGCVDPLALDWVQVLVINLSPGDSYIQRGGLRRKAIVPVRALLQGRSRLGNTRRPCAVKSIAYAGTHCLHLYIRVY
jgi:hypothetical protein